MAPPLFAIVSGLQRDLKELSHDGLRLPNLNASGVESVKGS
jgi:hypothetical protein